MLATSEDLANLISHSKNRGKSHFKAWLNLGEIKASFLVYKVCFKIFYGAGQRQLTSCFRTDRLLQTTETPVCQQRVVHTDPRGAFTNWLNEPSSHSLPVRAQFVLFNSLQEENRAESSFPFYLSATAVSWWLLSAFPDHTAQNTKTERGKICALFDIVKQKCDPLFCRGNSVTQHYLIKASQPSHRNLCLAQLASDLHLCWSHCLITSHSCQKSCETSRVGSWILTRLKWSAQSKGAGGSLVNGLPLFKHTLIASSWTLSCQLSQKGLGC